MAGQKFAIQKQIFEIEAFSRTGVHELQNRISKLANFKLQKKIEAYFDEVIPEDLLLKMNEFVLDIGTVNRDTLEDEIEERLINSLVDEFSYRLQLLKTDTGKTLSGISIETTDNGKLQLFAYYLLNGMLPWYADTHQKFSVDGLFQQLYTTNRPALKLIIEKQAKYPNVRQRIAFQFSETTIQQIINTIEPSASAYIFKTQKKIIQVQQEKQIVQASGEDFEKNLWLFILNYLFVEMSSRFQEKMFIKSSLVQIAARYSIHYQHLLHSFYEVLKDVKKDDAFQPLKAAVYELFTDETKSFTEQGNAPEITQADVPDILSLATATELLQHYFYTGVIPVAYSKMSRADMHRLLLKTAQTAPATIRTMILSLRNSRSAIYNFYQVVDDSDSEVLARLVLADNESEVADMVGMFTELHQVNPFSNLNLHELQSKAWQQLLHHLLMNTKPVYEVPVLIHYLVGSLANTTGLDKKDLAQKLKDSLQRRGLMEAETTAMQVLFQEVLDDILDTDLTNEAEQHSGYFDNKIRYGQNDPGSTYEADQLGNLIHYILLYGAVPWWGKDFYRIALEELIIRLYEKDINGMLILFRKAAVSPPMKARLLQHMPSTVMHGLMHELPGGAAVIKSIDELLLILDESGLMKYYASEFVQKNMLTVAWEVYSRAGYNLFPVTVFYHQTINRLSALLQISPAVFIATMIELPHKTRETTISYQAGNLLRQLLILAEEQQNINGGFIKQLPAEETSYSPAEEYSNDKLSSIEPATLINESKTIQQYFNFTEISAKAIINQLSEVLQYFLQWNRLPDSHIGLDKKEQQQLLREIIKILFAESPTTLQALFQNKGNSLIAAGYLADLFTDAEGGKEKMIAGFLLERYLYAGNMEARQNKEESYPETTIPEIPDFDLLQFFEQEPGLVNTVSDDFVLNESKRVLAFFLKYNRLPADIGITANDKIDSLLHKMMLLLFAKDKEFIIEQMQKPGSLLSAKLHLHDLLVVSYDIVTDQLKAFMQQIRETDLESLLRLNTEHEPSLTEGDLLLRINQTLETVTAGTLADERYAYLFSPAFAKMLLEKYGTDILLRLASLKINWPSATVPVMQGWLALLQHAFPSAPASIKLIELFNQFNIIFISGRLNIYSNDSYTRAFINYLSGKQAINSDEVFEQLLTYASSGQHKTTTGIADQYPLIKQLLPALIVKQHEMKMLDRSMAAADEKKLSAALNQETEVNRRQIAESLQKEIWKHAQTEIEMKDDDMDSRFIQERGESIYIGNAGLVLFHPFFETYFSRTGLMNDGIFKDDGCARRAVLLLQYLATGNTEHAEHELVLNKILCNIPLKEAIPVSFIATETEIEVTRDLLEMVIERWEKLKNTSVEGLQGSFIIRDGMLNFKEDYWSLKVEQRGYDVLLQMLPWAFGYIKTSWMQHNLIVEWI